MSDFPDADYLRAQAKRLAEFALEADDFELAARLRLLALNFELKARSAEAEEPLH